MHRRRFWLLWAVFTLSAALFVAGCGSARAAENKVARDPVLASWIAGVDRGKLQPIVDDLTGVSTPVIGGVPYRILTRFATSGTPADMGEQYVYEHLLSYGLSSVRYQTFVQHGVTYRNVIGEITGTGHPEEIVVVGPHLDSTSGDQSDSVAPGADDNASGVAAALYMAKVFAGHRFDRTIRFVFFDSEESGKRGSVYYVDKAKTGGDDIVAMLAPDMFGYNGSGDELELHTRTEDTAGAGADRAIAQTLVDVVTTYSISGVQPTILADGKDWSDQQLFWETGYPAIMVVQDLEQMNPRNHTAEDTVSHFVWSYYVGAAKALLGTVAREAGSLTTTPTTTATGVRNGAWYANAVQASLTAAKAPGGPAVASITYSVDGRSPTTVQGTSADVTVPASGAVNGPHVLTFHATNVDGGSEPDNSVTVNLDTKKPETKALAGATAKRHHAATIRFRVDDAPPNGGTATVVISVENAAGRVVMTAHLGRVQVNTRQSVAMKVAMPRGTYRLFVYASDAAGNQQSTAGHAALVVR